jgi:hypothetical protein
MLGDSFLAVRLPFISSTHMYLPTYNTCESPGLFVARFQQKYLFPSGLSIDGRRGAVAAAAHHCLLHVSLCAKEYGQILLSRCRPVMKITGIRKEQLLAC